MSWIQVYVTGLRKSIDPSNAEIERLLDVTYGLGADGDDGSLLWAGPDTTLVKRDGEGVCRGFAFLAFFSEEGATTVVDRINNSDYLHHHSNGRDQEQEELPQLRAELSRPKGKKNKKEPKGESLPDLRLRRMRKAGPIRKHPVITNSDGSRTNLGNKTK